MPTITEGNLRFDFPEGWTAWKYDEGDFYRARFIKIKNGIKALDIVAVDPEGEVWLIEIKDYRIRLNEGAENPADTVNASKLPDVVIRKVVGTLAAILPAKLHADSPENMTAEKILATTKLNPVLHIEQTKTSNKLHPYAIRPADIQQKLTTKFQRIGLGMLVTGTGSRTRVPWEVAPV